MAFGSELNKVDNDTNPFRYCGEYFDKETDSIYLRARYYNPSNGRFINEDEIIINSASEIAEYAKNGGIQAGDLMYFVDLDATNPHHATMVSKVENNEIYFTGHTKSRFDRELSISMDGQKVYIVRIRDDA